MHYYTTIVLKSILLKTTHRTLLSWLGKYKNELNNARVVKFL